MQECETGTGENSSVKRVTVRSGGAGHAHSGVAKTQGVAAEPSKPGNRKIVRLGR